MNINFSHISKNAEGAVIVYVCDEPANILPVQDVANSLNLLARKNAPVIITGTDPVNQPAALAELVCRLKSSGQIQDVCLVTRYNMTTLASPLSGVWPYVQEILEHVDHLNAGRETVDVLALRIAQGIRVTA